MFWDFARAAAGVESRRCRCDGDGDGDSDDTDKPSYDKLFVFGDSFADAGNLPKGDLKWETRGWYEPSGMSDADHDNKPTGRSSDGLVQSDFLGTYVSSQIDHQCSCYIFLISTHSVPK